MADEEQSPTEDANQEGRTIPAVWVGLDESPVRAANQFIGQAIGREQIIFTVGHFVMPPLLGTEEERREQAMQINFVPIQVVGRYAMNRTLLEQLRDVASEALDIHDRLYGGSEK